MTEAGAIELVMARFAAQWPIVQPTIPIALENEAFPAVDAFAVCSVSHTSSAQISMGTTGIRRVERKGYVYVKLWVPSDGGRALSAQLADSARAVFECIDLATGAEPVTLLAGETQEVGVDGRWYMSVVRFAFRYYASV